MNLENGSVGLLVAALGAVTIIVSLLVIDVAHVVAARAGLTTAADAAALAAAPVTFSSFGTSGNPRQAAAVVAAANGAVLVDCECDIDSSWATRRVTVTVGLAVDLVLLSDQRLAATAAAEFRPVVLGLGDG